MSDAEPDSGFTLCVNRTVNGVGRTFFWGGLSAEDRPALEQLIDLFDAGQLPMEGTLTFTAAADFPQGLTTGRGPENPDWSRSWRWADIKKIWIEEGRR